MHAGSPQLCMYIMIKYPYNATSLASYIILTISIAYNDVHECQLLKVAFLCSDMDGLVAIVIKQVHISSFVDKESNSRSMILLCSNMKGSLVIVSCFCISITIPIIISLCKLKG